MKEINLIAVFIFYSIANGAQSKLSFSQEFKHCNIITFDGSDWIMLDFDRTGLLTRKIKCTSGDKLINSLHIIKDVTAVISVNIEKRKKIMWKPFWVRSCNEICRYASGIDIGFTFNPVHLYRKLLKYRYIRNYEILSSWRRKDGLSISGKRAKSGGAISRRAIRAESRGDRSEEAKPISD